MPNISVLGRATEDDPDPYWLNLYAFDHRWDAGEPLGAHRICDTRTGSWLFKPISDPGVYASGANGNVIIFLRGLDPATARVGDHGQGHAYEKARVIDWRIDSL